MKKTFTENVCDVVSKIPAGKVLTYGDVALRAGNAKACRAVGSAMRTNTDTARVPCHRVVGSTGALTGYAFGNGLSTKRKLLESEGVVFIGQRVDLRTSRFTGSH